MFIGVSLDKQLLPEQTVLQTFSIRNEYFETFFQPTLCRGIYRPETTLGNPEVYVSCFILRSVTHAHNLYERSRFR